MRGAKEQCAVAANRSGSYAQTLTDMTNLEEKIAHLTKTVDELSDIVARQEADLATALLRIDMLMQREAGREMDSGGSIPLVDQRPPHW